MKQPRVMARKPRIDPAQLKGVTLYQPITTGNEYAQAVRKLTEEMTSEVSREIEKLFKHSDAPVLANMGATTDASITGSAKALLDRMRSRFFKQFDEMGKTATSKMIDRTVESSATNLKQSLRELAPDVTIKLSSISPALRDVISASTDQAVSLIKRVPVSYLDKINGAVMRSITSGQGLADLQPELEKQGVEIRNWAKNVALDQTRKVYNSVNRERMKSAGIRKFEWIHSGGSNQPRPYHMNVLAGQIFDIDNPPIIDQNTGERGYPGQLPYCRCTMRPVIDFED